MRNRRKMETVRIRKANATTEKDIFKREFQVASQKIQKTKR